MRAVLRRDLTPLRSGDAAPSATPPAAPRCDYDAAAIAATPRGLDSLRGRMYACYGWAQHHVAVGTDTMDRLSVLGALGRTDDPDRRERLFRSLDPVWRSVNGGNEPESPYRRMIALEAARRRGRELPARRQARLTGVPADSLEHWLLAILETWRDATPDSLMEPWDWYYRTGTASRRLGARISHERMLQLNTEVYRALGADLAALNVRYDLEPREGKTPVAFCTFGARPRRQGGRWSPGEPSVFATYRDGGLDNLAELLHETGHAVHIAAIRTRPAFADWPDSDPFTEAIADYRRAGCGGPRVAAAVAGRLGAAGRGPEEPLRRDRAGRGLVAVRAAHAAASRPPTPTRCGPGSPTTICASGPTRSCPGGRCAASWSIPPAT